MTIKTNAQVLINRVKEKLNVIDFEDPETDRKIVRIALLLENQTKINVRRRRLVDTGALLNSIKSIKNISKDGSKAVIEYGSYGVRYAAIHEYGLTGTLAIRSHDRKYKSGTVAQVRQHTRRVKYPERSYIRLSLVQQRRKILKMLRE